MMWARNIRPQHFKTPLNWRLRSPLLIPTRHKALVSKFLGQKITRTREPLLEEPVSDNNKGSEAENNILATLKHYLKSEDVSGASKKTILNEKLKELIQLDQGVLSNAITVIDATFLKTLELNNRKSEKSVLEHKYKVKLFIETLRSLSCDSNLPIPKYMSILSIEFLNLKQYLSSDLLAHIIELSRIASGISLAHSLLLLLKRDVSSDLFDRLFELYATKGKVNLQFFEEVFDASLETKNFVLINESFYESFMKHIETIFQNYLPKVHEYKNFEKSLDKVDFLFNEKFLSTVVPDQLLLGVHLNLVRLILEIDSVKCSDYSSDNKMKILSYLESVDQQALANSLIEESKYNQTVIESLLFSSWGGSPFHNINKTTVDVILKYPANYSEELKLQCVIYDRIISEHSEDAIFDAIKKILEESRALENETNYQDLLTRAIRVLISKDVDPDGELVNRVLKYFSVNFGSEENSLSCKHRLDKAIECDDQKLALQIFEKSLKSSFSWGSELEPSIHLTLNNLVILLCNNMGSIDSVFPKFKLIKQQLVDSTLNIDAIIAMARLMLDAEYVGDLIELLKRELPSIKKDEKIKLPNNREFGKKYQELFELLHNFVVNYTNEETYETNWVLYGELHKYFYVPHDSYLPAMNFFCEHDRLHASLLIFRQMKMLSELHGDHFHMPPLRDIYLYLFQTFGDKYYQEGVEEIHSSFKMDTTLQQSDIEMQNCILNAYSSLQDVGKAKDLFLSMSSNLKRQGGINEQTVQIMIKTYTYSDLIYVKKFWNNLSKYEIIPNYPIFKQYLIAHVYHGNVKEALKLTDEMDDYDLPLSVDTLIALHNYCCEKGDQNLVIDWAEKRHRDLWEKAVESNQLREALHYAPDNNLIEGS